MAERRPRRSRSNLLALIIGSGLAAVIAAIGGFVAQSQKIAQESEIAQCALAASILQDETLSPYLIEADRRKLMVLAVSRSEACMEDRE